MPAITAFAVAAVAIAAMQGFRWWFSDEQVTRRALGNVQPTRIADVKEGDVVKLVGTAVADGKTLTAPISGRACVAWSVVIEERRSSGKRHHWRRIHQAAEDCSFFLEDESGRARIELTHARVVLNEDHYGERGGWLNDPTEALVAYCNANGIVADTLFGERRMRSREGALEPGETVAVMGVAAFEDDTSGAGEGYRGPARRLVLLAPSDAPLLLSDHRH